MWPAAADVDDPALQSSNASLPPQKRRTSLQSRGATTGRGGPTTFFFRTEQELEQGSENAASAAVDDSTYGVQSLTSNVSSTHEDGYDAYGHSRDGQTQAEIEPGASVNDHTSLDLSATATPYQNPLQRTTSNSSGDSSSSRPLPRDVSTLALSGRLTPQHVYSPIGGTESRPTSTPKSVSLKSLQLSDDGSAGDDAASQAITSGDEEDDSRPEATQEFHEAPQLVMPNLRMPTRRPFTARGKEIGKLKILVAGAKGAGKTSLIKSIVQACEDIVHVDPLTSSSLTITNSERRNTKNQSHLQGSISTEKITEIFASTRAYPSWWSDLGESRILRRRQSLGEQVLERNICFVDTPGFDPDSPSRQSINAIIEHVEASLRRNLSFTSLSDGELLSILSGNGGVQVDLVLYIFSKNPTAFDLDLIRQLSQLSFVVPVVSKADLLSDDDLIRLSTCIMDDLRSADISIANFETPLFPSSPTRSVWTVSSASADDDDNMDASLLMSPEYVQPLAPSDLSLLVSHIFDSEKAAWLRHMAVKKCLRWRRAHAETMSTAQSFDGQVPPLDTSTNRSPAAAPPTGTISPVSSLLSSTSASPAVASHSQSLPLTTTATALYRAHDHLPGPIISPSPFTTARFADHTQREELLAQARLARWATDLKKSLENERARFESLHRAERRGWLLARWGELQLADADTDAGNDADNAWAAPPHLDADSPVPPKALSSDHLQPRPQLRRAPTAVLDPRDPLGLLAWDERLRRGGAVVVTILGGCGVLGAVAVWIVRRWGWSFFDGGRGDEGGFLFGGQGGLWSPQTWFGGGESGD